MNEIYQKTFTLSQREHYSLNSLKIFQHDTFPQDEFKFRSIETNSKKTLFQESGVSTLENLRNLELSNQNGCEDEDSSYNWEDALANLERKSMSNSAFMPVKYEESGQKSNINSFHSGNSSYELGKFSSMELSGTSSTKKNIKPHGMLDRSDQKMVSEENSQREYREIQPMKMYIKASEPKKVGRKNQHLLLSNSKLTMSSQRSNQSGAQKRNFQTGRYRPSQAEIKEEYTDNFDDLDDEIEDVEYLGDTREISRAPQINNPIGAIKRAKLQNITNHVETSTIQTKVERKPSSLNDTLKMELARHQAHPQSLEKVYVCIKEVSSSFGVTSFRFAFLKPPISFSFKEGIAIVNMSENPQVPEKISINMRCIISKYFLSKNAFGKNVLYVSKMEQG